ncbi:piggyBac transposable element-derived protein 4-like [Pangasianodon hypophthalmus]|uniref:piggyBac transposable element-derived protein 4-like n=1 Tax=Pangasianodon hypophthalmus TaxID=310915 RepID=UPI0023070E98|nr:piggyBac transposable element-derived protein 4-like [Pangasianodon hypophthalmus]
MMARYAGEEALRLVLDSDEEITFSSEEECDPAEDLIPDEREKNSAKEPVAKRAKADKQPTLSWNTETDVDVAPQALRFLPTRQPGPQLDPRPCDAHTPMSLFKMFFSATAVSTLCRNTNAQAARARAKGHKYKWTDVSISELYCYIGLLFYMAMVKLRSVRDYWRQDSLFSIPFPATIMSRDRYRTISWNLHMSHPDAEKDNDRKRGTAEHDRLFRVRPLMDTIRHACKAIYHPRQNLAVDERMVACKANTGMTQYMKAIPTRETQNTSTKKRTEPELELELKLEPEQSWNSKRTCLRRSQGWQPRTSPESSFLPAVQTPASLSGDDP